MTTQVVTIAFMAPELLNKIGSGGGERVYDYVLYYCLWIILILPVN